MTNLKEYLDQYDAASDIRRYSASDILTILEKLSEIRRQINENFVLRDGHDKNTTLGRWVAQSQMFVVDCIPHILETFREHHRRSDTVTLLDVGSATGAGTSLLHALLSTDMLWCPARVTGIDIFPNRVLCAKNNFNDFEYVVSDIFEHGRTYDYVFCSHVLEHVKEPRPFIQRLLQMARRTVFLYTPYAEQDPIPGHRWSVTEAFYEDFEVTRFARIKSPGWRWGKPSEDFCLLAILRGQASDARDAEPAHG